MTTKQNVSYAQKENQVSAKQVWILLKKKTLKCRTINTGYLTTNQEALQVHVQ